MAFGTLGPVSEVGTLKNALESCVPALVGSLGGLHPSVRRPTATESATIVTSFVFMAEKVFRRPPDFRADRFSGRLSLSVHTLSPDLRFTSLPPAPLQRGTQKLPETVSSTCMAIVWP